MQMIQIIVDRQRVLFSVQRELAFSDSIANATSRASEILVIFRFVTRNVIPTEDTIRDRSVLVGQMQFSQRRTASHDLGHKPLAAFQRVNFNGRTVFRFTKRFRLRFLPIGYRGQH